MVQIPTVAPRRGDGADGPLPLPRQKNIDAGRVQETWPQRPLDGVLGQRIGLSHNAQDDYEVRIAHDPRDRERRRARGGGYAVPVVCHQRHTARMGEAEIVGHGRHGIRDGRADQDQDRRLPCVDNLGTLAQPRPGIRARVERDVVEIGERRATEGQRDTG